MTDAASCWLLVEATTVAEVLGTATLDTVVGTVDVTILLIDVGMDAGDCEGGHAVGAKETAVVAAVRMLAAPPGVMMEGTIWLKATACRNAPIGLTAAKLPRMLLACRPNVNTETKDKYEHKSAIEISHCSGNLQNVICPMYENKYLLIIIIIEQKDTV